MRFSATFIYNTYKKSVVFCAYSYNVYMCVYHLSMQYIGFLCCHCETFSAVHDGYLPVQGHIQGIAYMGKQSAGASQWIVFMYRVNCIYQSFVIVDVFYRELRSCLYAYKWMKRMSTIFYILRCADMFAHVQALKNSRSRSWRSVLLFFCSRLPFVCSVHALIRLYKMGLCHIGGIFPYFRDGQNGRRQSVA